MVPVRPGRGRQEDEEFKVILSSILSSRLSWATGYPASRWTSRSEGPRGAGCWKGLVTLSSQALTRVVYTHTAKHTNNFLISLLLLAFKKTRLSNNPGRREDNSPLLEVLKVTYFTSGGGGPYVC